MEILQAEPLLFLWLAFMGLGVGFLTGMFGIGGAFITTPVMIGLFGLEPSLAVGCSMGFTLVNGALGLKRHSGAGNFEPAAMWPIAIAACVGTLVGYQFHKQLEEACGANFATIVNLMFCVILIPIGLLVWWQSDKSEGMPILSRFKVPKMATLRQEGLPPVSLTLLAAIGLSIGIAKGMLGIGGGIILVPTLVLLVGLLPHRAVTVSLGMVVLSSIIGTYLFARDGHVNIFIIGAMVLGSYGGVILGTRYCNVASPKTLKRLLATLILCFSTYLGYQVVTEWDTATATESTAAECFEHGTC